MDLSKLPRLSNTGTPPPPDVTEQLAGAPRAVLPAVERDPDAFVGTGADMWLSGAVGVLFLLLGLSFGKSLVARLTGGTYHTGVNWVAGPKAGQEVTYPELEG